MQGKLRKIVFILGGHGPTEKYRGSVNIEEKMVIAGNLADLKPRKNSLKNKTVM